LDRLEQIVGILAENRVELQKGHVEMEKGLAELRKLVADLATETRRGFDRVAAQFEVIGRQMAENAAEMREYKRETDAQMREYKRETDAQMRESKREADERGKRLDERIDKLVIAIGEFIRRQDESRT